MDHAEEGKSLVQPPSGTPPPASNIPPPAPSLASIEDFKKITLRVGVIVAAADHPQADRLLVLSVDIGEGAPRQVVAGIKGTYQPAELIGKRVAVVTNLKPAVLRGIESQGMVLAAQDSSQLALLSLDRPIQPGGLIK